MSAARGRRRGPDRAGVRGARRRLGARRRGADAVVRARRDRDLRPRGLHDRAHGADQHRPGAPQLRRRDARGARRAVRRARALGRRPRRASCGRRSSTLVPSFTGETTLHAARPVHATTSRSPRRSTSTRCPTARCRSRFHFTGSVLLRRRRRPAAGRADPVDVLARVAHAGGHVARDDGALLPQRRLGAPARRHDRRARAHGAPHAACRPSTPAWPSCWRMPEVNPALEELARTRCSSRATRSTRTRPARPRTRRRRRSGSSTRRPTRSRRRARSTSCGCSASRSPAATRCSAARCASCRAPASGHQAVPRRLDAPGARSPTSLRRRTSSRSSSARSTGASGCRPRTSATGAGASTLCVHNTTRGRRAASTAPGALRHSLLSTHPVAARIAGGRFVSPLEAPEAASSVNTCPVLATRGRRRAARRGDHAARPSAARAREPRRPVRRHRDRGGAAAARARALRRRARGRSPTPTPPCGR